MELAEKSVVLHDDRLLVRAQKSDIGMNAGWKYEQSVNVIYNDTGEPVILRWYNNKLQESRENVDDIPQSELIDWKPVYLRGIELAKGIRVRLQDNRLDLYIDNLQEDLKSRYKIALDCMVELVKKGILSYKPNAEMTVRNMREAIRNRLKRHASVVSYEHNILIGGELGKQLYKDLEHANKAPEIYGNAENEYKGTVYFKGFNRHKKTQKAQKMYNVKEKEGIPQTLYKIETTYLKHYFRLNDMRGIEKFLTQDKIQYRLRKDLNKDIAKLLRKLSEETMSMLNKELGLSMNAKPNATAEVMTGRSNTLTDRVNKLEAKMEEHDREIQELKKRLK